MQYYSYTVPVLEVMLFNLPYCKSEINFIGLILRAFFFMTFNSSRFVLKIYLVS